MNDSTKYEYATGEDDVRYVCPMESIGANGRVSTDKLDGCVEADVVGRYSGIIQLASKNAGSQSAF